MGGVHVLRHSLLESLVNAFVSALKLVGVELHLTVQFLCCRRKKKAGCGHTHYYIYNACGYALCYVIQSIQHIDK